MAASFHVFRILNIAFLIVLIGSIGQAEIPDRIHYQGYLTDQGGEPLDGNFSLNFTLYDEATDGNKLWNELQTISIAKGIFNVELGAITPLSVNYFADAQRYLEIRILNIHSTWEPLLPRLPMTSTGFTMHAADADTLEGFRSVDFSPIDHEHDDYVQVGGDSIAGSLVVEGSFSVGTATDGDSDFLYMDSGQDEWLQWDDTNNRFILSDDLYVRNAIQVGWASANVVYSRLGGANTSHASVVDGESDLLINGALEVDFDAYFDSGKLYLGTTSGTNDDIIYMDDGSEQLSWDNDVDNNNTNGLEGRFLLSDQLFVDGKIKTASDVVIPATSAFAYATPKTEYLNMSAAAFIKDETLTNVVWTGGGWYMYTSDQGTDDHCFAYAPVYLPAGAVITDVKGHYMDNSGADVTLSVFLDRVSFIDGSTDRMARGDETSTGFSTVLHHVADNDGIIEYPTISTEYAYYAFISWNPSETTFTNRLRFYGVTIVYTVRSVD